jgi:hypothetical protein
MMIVRKVLTVLRVTVGLAMCALGAFLVFIDLPTLNWGLPLGLVAWGGILISWDHLWRSASAESVQDAGRARTIQKLRAFARLGWLLIAAGFISMYASAKVSGGGVLGAVLLVCSLALVVVGVTLGFLPLLYARISALHAVDIKRD